MLKLSGPESRPLFKLFLKSDILNYPYSPGFYIHKGMVTYVEQDLFTFPEHLKSPSYYVTFALPNLYLSIFVLQVVGSRSGRYFVLPVCFPLKMLINTLVFVVISPLLRYVQSTDEIISFRSSNISVIKYFKYHIVSKLSFQFPRSS